MHMLTLRSKPERIGDESRILAGIVFVHGYMLYFAGTTSRDSCRQG